MGVELGGEERGAGALARDDFIAYRQF